MSENKLGAADPVAELHAALELPRPELLAWLDGLSPAQRKKAATAARAAQFGWNDPRTGAVTLVVLACAAGAKRVAQDLEWDPVAPSDRPHAVAVLAGRPPEFVLTLVETVLGQDRPVAAWGLVRALVRAGLVPMPDAPGYAIAMPYGMTMADQTVLAALDADAGVLDVEVWRLFSEQGCAAELQSHDSETFMGRTSSWRDSLVELAAEGRLDRARLLDAALGAFLRDWPAHGMGWYVSLLEALEPNADELVSRQDVLVRLLTTPYGQAVQWAQKQLLALVRAGSAELDPILATSPAVLDAGGKGVAQAQLKLLTVAAKATPDRAPECAAAAAAGLAHAAPDVQCAALALVEAHMPEDQRAGVVAPYAALVSPTLRARLPKAEEQAVSSLLVEPPPVVAAAPVGPVVPVRDADELLEVLSRLVEEADDPVEVERALEGAARLARQRPADGQALAARARELLEEAYYPGPFQGEELRADLCVLALVWLTGADPGGGYPGQHRENDYTGGRHQVIREDGWHLPALLARRVHEVATLVHSGGGQLLSLPSTTDGAIDPADLAARLIRVPRTAPPLPLDVSFTALRLPLAFRPGGMHRTGRALAAALEMLVAVLPRYERVAGPAPAKYGADREHCVGWAVTSTTRKATDAVAALHDVPEPLRQLGQSWDHGEYSSRFEQLTAWWPLVLPGRPELLAAHSHGRLMRALHKNRSGTAPLLHALGEAGRNGPVASSALALGLAAKNGDERTAAIDALVALAERDHLDGAELGRQLAAHLADDVIVGTRAIDSLRELARAQPRAAGQALSTVEEVLELATTRKDAAAWLGFAAELAADLRRQARTGPLVRALAARTGQTAAIRAARELTA